jgi:hypothetical protein
MKAHDPLVYGGDDWCSTVTYNWLLSHPQLVRRTDDISKEHGATTLPIGGAAGHQMHHQGLDLDMFHPVVPDSIQMESGGGVYEALRSLVASSVKEYSDELNGVPGVTAVNRDRLNAWILATRQYLEQLSLGDNTVRLFAYIDGKSDSGQLVQLLKNGKLGNADSLILELECGVWNAYWPPVGSVSGYKTKIQKKWRIWPNHYSHIRYSVSAN